MSDTKREHLIDPDLNYCGPVFIRSKDKLQDEFNEIKEEYDSPRGIR